MDVSFLQEVEKFTNLKTSLDVKKRNAFEKAQNKLNFAYNDSSRDLILLDVNQNPICISDVVQFITKAESSYYEAMNEYHILHEELKSQRSVKKVMGND